jgi:hypothetical protein
MNSELASIVVLVLIAAGAFFAYRANDAYQKRKTEALTSPKKMEDWMAVQGFSPDHFSFFHGTGIALNDADSRVVLYSIGTPKFHSIADILTIRSYESFDRGVPRGAAPGVVELNVAQRFIIDISPKNTTNPCKVFFASKELSGLWENRLNALIGHK